MTRAAVEDLEIPVSDSASTPRFQQTIDRDVVHRASVHEVFVTDVHTVNDRHCVAGVQLPQSHAYFNDHTQDPALTDILLVLESCRQVAICGAHITTGVVPTGTSMMVDTFAIRLTKPSALVGILEPIDLVVRTDFVGEVSRSGRLRRGRVEQVLVVDGEDVGTHEMDVMFVRGSQHDAMRRAQRGSVPPTTADLSVPDETRQVEPSLVGRQHPRNVVLSTPEVTAGEIVAEVTPHPGNRGLFDHTYDHLPAMTLTEAARQIALLGLDQGTGASAARTLVVGLTSQYFKFAELDEPLQVRAPVAMGPLTGPTDVTCVFEQGGSPVAETTVTLIPSDHVRHPVEP